MARHRSLTPRAALAALAAALTMLPALASSEEPAPSAARAGDVDSPESVVRAMYQSVSCLPAPDWDRFKSLFFPGARLVNVRRSDESGGSLARGVSPDDFAARAAVTAVADKFTQRELNHKALRYGDLVLHWSAYEARRSPANAPPLILRGIQSFQLVRSDGRWWITEITWQNDLDAGPVPDEYLR
jgi:hypothetical protein